MQKIILSLFLSYAWIVVLGQQPLHVPVNIQKAYENQTRDESGAPGINYWQNKAVYHISVKLQPDLSKITGIEKISYINNSPDTLKEIVISLLTDIYKKGNQNDFDLPINALNEGVIIEKLAIRGQEIDMSGSDVLRSGTNLFVELDKAVEPGEHIEIAVNWNFVYPKSLTIRCGDYGDSTFFVAYFYPKVAVYDDLDGWDRHNYTGFAEFYGDFNDFYVDITVPGDFKVWATGELMNANAVLSAEYYQKWLEAQQSTDVYSMIGKEDYLNPGITKENPWNTWQFKAMNVTDFAFGTSDKFLWDVVNVVVDSITGRMATFNAAYRVDSEDYYKMAELGKKVLTDYSTRIPGIPYPYPAMTIFNGNSGMEFPMMCNNVSCIPWHESAGLAYHEVAHTYFPFHVGTNERKYAWMDEGWANLFPLFYFEEHSPEYDFFKTRMDRYYGVAGKEIEVPSMTPGDILTIRPPYRQASYNKPFFAYYQLYEYLGVDLFTKALQHYADTWAGKHPMPYDFFYSFNHVTGKDLNWFWKNWFFDRNHADLSLSKFEDGMIEIENIGGLFVPVELDIMYKRGYNTKIRKDLDIWKGGERKISIKIKDADQVKSIRLGNDRILDVDTDNNVLEF
jgi:hypothetical protein